MEINPIMFIYYWVPALLHPRQYRRHMSYVAEQNKYLDGLPYDETIYNVDYLKGKP
jgi:hypothetical protein